MEILICYDDITIIQQIQKILEHFFDNKKMFVHISTYISGKDCVCRRKNRMCTDAEPQFST